MLVLLATYFVAWPIGALQTGGQSTPGYTLYELYSWQTSKRRDWFFSVLYNTRREKSVREVFDKKTALKGVDQLKRKISELPAGSKILWLSQLTANGQKQKGSERLRYPPTNVIEEITRYAQSRNIQMLGPFGHRTP